MMNRKQDNNYEVIYTDPPWSYNSNQHAKVGFRGDNVTEHYSTMSHKEMKDLDVNGMSADNCIMFMWVTSPHLAEAIELGKAWGFKYSTVGFVWDKQKTMPGSYTMSQCEMVLIFKKGKIPQNRGARNIKQFLSEGRREHSRKPSEIRDRITQMFPNSRKLEMFARCAPEGWDVWGNETDKFEDG